MYKVKVKISWVSLFATTTNQDRRKPRHPSDEVKQAWITYRQALRDLPSNSTPLLNKDDQLTNITWPTPPS